jgi:peptidoglycan/xylan/chitin deacetylase (PgdA/CDA1 family)
MRTLLSRRAGTYLMRLLPLQVYGRILPREVVGLCYHVVSERRLPHVANLYPYKSPEQFEADLVYLKRNFRVVSYAELVRGRVDPNAVHISFDDGYAECFDVVRPLLLKHGLPCTFFVNTDVLDNRRMLGFNRVSLCLEALRGMDAAEANRIVGEFARDQFVSDVGGFAIWIRRGIRNPDSGAEEVLDRLCARLGVDVDGFLTAERPYMTRAQVRQMADEGFTIGGHTRMHWHMGSTHGEDRIEREIVESCRVVAEVTGSERVPFAFPYDAEGVDRAFLAGVLERNPFLGRLFGTGSLEVDAPFMVNRMLADSPPAVGRARSNLPGLLSGAYLNEFLSPKRQLAVSR